MESVNEFARLCGGIEPVSVKAAHAESRICLREGCGKAPAVIFRKIEIIHGAGDVEIAVCIEAIDEADPLMPQIAFHLKLCVEAEAFRIARLQPTHDLLRQDRFGQIRDVRGHKGQGPRSDEHTSELQSLMSRSYPVFCLKNKT